MVNELWAEVYTMAKNINPQKGGFLCVCMGVFVWVCVLVLFIYSWMLYAATSNAN